MSRVPNPQLAVDFVNTVDWRTDPERHKDALRSFDDLVRWAHDHDVLSDTTARTLTRRGRQHPKLAGQVFDRALTLRDAIYRVLSAVAAQRESPRADLEIISREAGFASPQLQLTQTANDFSWEWNSEPDAFDRVLWPVVQSSTELLTSELLNRIRECEGPGCGWIILDHTKNRSKRWCEMKTCGNRAKVKRFYERHKQELVQK